jgi:lipopolysaccharide/colanic/teichoic acid biosynthesis glycosyltransferase
MTVQETGAVVQAAQRNDARVTRFGAFLRKSSIDELPQLINVLKGEMSFIGPRPHAVAHDRKFSKICRDYPKRFAARPGISGLAQISGSRGSIETDEQLIQRVAFDLEYIERWSFMFDLMIIWKTVVHVAGSKDAY